MLGAQAAREQEKREGRYARGIATPAQVAATITERERQDQAMRLSALELAQRYTGTALLPEDVVKRAETYAAFIKGETHG